MQELRVFAWCDICNAEGGQAEAKGSYLVSITAMGKAGRAFIPRRLDLCDVHIKPLDEVIELLKHGTVPPPPKAEQAETAEPPARLPKRKETSDKRRWAVRPGTCPLCERVMQSHSVRGHLLEIHDAKPITQPKRCPDCGSSHPVARAMIQHRAKIHDYDYMAELASRAKR